MSEIDELMGFDSRDLSAFQEKAQSNNYDENIYKTNPKNSKTEDGRYHSKVRVVYNPFNVKQSIVHQATYYLQDAQGGMLVRSKLGDGDKTCPIFTAFKQLWYSGDESKKNFAKDMFQKTESDWCIVQVTEDENQPELVGKFMIMKLAQAIYEKTKAKMNPSVESKKSPIPVMDYLIGLPLILDVQPGPDDPNNPARKQREISYNLCDFDDEYMPIMKIDGTPLFTDEELELIDSYAVARKDSVSAKTEAKRNAALQTLNDLNGDIKELYKKSLDYMKTVAPDLEKECKYQPWDEYITNRINNWIENVVQGVDPKTVSNVGPTQGDAITSGIRAEVNVMSPSDPFASIAEESASSSTSGDDDLPF